MNAAAPRPQDDTFETLDRETVEKREFARDPAKDLCEIRLSNREFAAGCMVQDISPTGARLLVSCGDLPNRFLLVNHTRRTRQLCRLIWRQGGNLGVRFLTAPRPFEPGDSL